MRDIELIHIADTAAIPPEVVDAAYVAASPGGVLDDTTLTDPSFTDAGAYGKPSLGGEYGPGKSLLLGGPTDGGEAALGEDVIGVAAAPDFVVKAAYALAGRSWNPATPLNLYPWHKSPPQGLDSNNNPAVPGSLVAEAPAAAPPEPAPSPPPPAPAPAKAAKKSRLFS